MFLLRCARPFLRHWAERGSYPLKTLNSAHVHLDETRNVRAERESEGEARGRRMKEVSEMKKKKNDSQHRASRKAHSFTAHGGSYRRTCGGAGRRLGASGSSVPTMSSDDVDVYSESDSPSDESDDAASCEGGGVGSGGGHDVTASSAGGGGGGGAAPAAGGGSSPTGTSGGEEEEVGVEDEGGGGRFDVAVLRRGESNRSGSEAGKQEGVDGVQQEWQAPL